MRRKLIGVAAGLSATILLALPALAAQAPTTEDFVKSVAISDMFEIQSGELASEKAQNGDVRSFGKKMVVDHTKTSDELKGLVNDKAIKGELPGKLDAEHQTNLDKLTELSGVPFDKEFVQMQIDAHQKAVGLFENYAATGENDDLKAWAKNTLPALKQHLEHAQKLKTVVDQTANAGDTKNSDTAKVGNMADGTTAQNEPPTVTANDDIKKPTHTSNIKYVTRQTPTDWTAEALIGRTVQNDQGNKLGDINNVIINEKGDVVAVVIGVGGFLGIGEKNVGVPFDALDFRAVDPADKRADETKDEKAEQKTNAMAARFDTEHANMHIVLNTTKEDLEAAPAFAWLDEQAPDGGTGSAGEK